MPYSYVQYAGTGTTGPFSVPFPYLLKGHVKLYRGLNLLTGTYTQLLVDGTDYTWPSATQVQLTSALVNSTTLTIRRETPTSTRLVDWNDGSNLNAADMDTADLQNFYAVQDQQDKNETVTAAQITTAADAAAALAAVNQTLPYAAVGTVAGIPAGTNGARIEVANSTGIESFSPLAGRPAGFVGSSQIRVRLTYTTAGSTWNWVDYAVADPDGRYVRQSNISDSTSTTSSTTVASSTAVKAAKDAADAAQSNANTKAPIASPTFTGTVTIPAGASISGFAPLASPTFTDTPAAPTASAGTNTTQLATTAFVATATGALAPLASPQFTGTPAAPTAAAGTNSTQLATTAFVVSATANASPVLGTQQSPTAGATNITFTGIPSWAKRVTLSWSALTMASGYAMLRLGTSSGLKTSGYGTAPSTNYTWIKSIGGGEGIYVNYTNLGVYYFVGVYTGSGNVSIVKMSNTAWMISGMSLHPSASYVVGYQAYQVLASDLTQIALVGDDSSTFNAGGNINLLYE